MSDADITALVAMLRHIQCEPASFDTYSMASAAERAADAIERLRSSGGASETLPADLRETYDFAMEIPGLPGERIRKLVRDYNRLRQSPPEPAPKHPDTDRLDAIAREIWKLDCFDIPTSGDDADIGWRVVEYRMGKPSEVVIAEVYRDDPRAAIDMAIKQPLTKAGES